MNSEAYKKLIDEDIEWLNKQPKTLEREHIKHVVEESINFYYPNLVENLPVNDVVGRSEQLVCDCQDFKNGMVSMCCQVHNENPYTPD